MKKAHIISICIIPVIVAAALYMPITALFKKHHDTQYTFNLDDIITDASRNPDAVNTFDYFQKYYSNKMYKPTPQELLDWQNVSNRPEVVKRLVSKMSKEQLSYDIAYYISNWWYDWYVSAPETSQIFFLPNFGKPGWTYDWLKQWDFNVNVTSFKINQNSFTCSYECNFHNNAWQDETHWAKTLGDSYDYIDSDARVNVVNANFLFGDENTPPTDYHYHIDTENIPLWNDKGRTDSYMSVSELRVSTNIWYVGGYENFGGHDDNGPKAFKINSFILNKFAL